VISNDPLRPRPCSATVAALEQILCADRFDESAVSALTTRDTFPDAAWVLTREVETRPHAESFLIPALLNASATIAPYRLAVAIGAHEFTHRLFTTVEILERSGNENAELVLALLGKLRDWRMASRRLRAAHALQVLVRDFRSRA
jgi:hypothetical protein